MTKSKRPAHCADCAHASNLVIVDAMDHLLGQLQIDGDRISQEEWIAVKKYLADWRDRLYPPPFKPGGRWPHEVHFEE